MQIILHIFQFAERLLRLQHRGLKLAAIIGKRAGIDFFDRLPRVTFRIFGIQRNFRRWQAVQRDCHDKSAGGLVCCICAVQGVSRRGFLCVAVIIFHGFCVAGVLLPNVRFKPFKLFDHIILLLFQRVISRQGVPLPVVVNIGFAQITQGRGNLLLKHG